MAVTSVIDKHIFNENITHYYSVGWHSDDDSLIINWDDQNDRRAGEKNKHKKTKTNKTLINHTQS